MAELFSLIDDRKTCGLAIVGMTKNVGKTVTLNYLISRIADAGDLLGIVSAGYDGERFDRLTLKEKPRIYAPVGTVIATAEACFEAAEAQLKLLLRSSISTPLGEVCLGRVVSGGLVELAGPGSTAALKQLVSDMKGYCVEQFLIDGAINRMASASPRIAGGTILATGGSVAPAIEDIIQKTLFRSTVLETPAVEEKSLGEAARTALNQAGAAMIHTGGGGWETEPIRASIPLLAGEDICKRYDNGVAAVVLGGALVEDLLQKMLKLKPLPLVILRDATKIFASYETYHRFTRRGGRIRVLQPINLIAVTVNPTDPLGKGYPPKDFFQQMEQALAPRPVFDLVLNEGFRAT